MATFKVGDRARIVCSYAINFGRTGVVTSQPIKSYSVTTGRLEYVHYVTVDGIGASDADGIPWGYAAEDLEPIHYDGNQIISWEQMKELWTPEKAGSHA